MKNIAPGPSIYISGDIFSKQEQKMKSLRLLSGDKKECFLFLE